MEDTGGGEQPSISHPKSCIPQELQLPEQDSAQYPSGLAGMGSVWKRDQDTCKGHGRAASPPHAGAWSGVMPGVPYRSRKARIYQLKARMQQQKSQDAAAAKLLHTRRKKNNSRGGCRSVCSSPAPSRAFWRSFGTISEPELIMELHTPPSKPGKHKFLQETAVSKERLPSQSSESQEIPSGNSYFIHF